MNCKHFWFTSAVMLCLMFLIGCGQKDKIPEKQPVQPVSGKATRGNGKPAYHIKIVLRSIGKNDPNAIRPSAITEADGTFKVGTYTIGDGIPEGEYSVSAYDGSGAQQQVIQPASVTINATTKELPPIVLK